MLRINLCASFDESIRTVDKIYINTYKTFQPIYVLFRTMNKLIDHCHLCRISQLYGIKLYGKPQSLHTHANNNRENNVLRNLYK